MLINTIIICSTILAFIAAIVVIAFLIIKPYFTSIAASKANEVQNEKYKLFTTISPEAVQVSIDTYVDNIVSKYIVFKFVSKKKGYINDQETDAMVKDITKMISLDISELYIFYIRMVADIHDDDGLLRYIHGKVRNAVVDNVSKYNSATKLSEPK